MGCDIHWTIEIRRGDKWVGVLNDCGLKCPASERWYAFFGELAGVRAESETSYPQRGLPDDVSDLTLLNAEASAWDHSGSWLTVDEFVRSYNRALVNFMPRATPITRETLFGFDYWPFDSDAESRVVFAFDN